MDTTTAVIVGGLIAGAAGILSALVPQLIQLAAMRSQQAHELKRDQRAKLQEFALQEYKERQEACADLLAAARYTSIAFGSRYRALKAANEPHSGVRDALVTNEAKNFAQHEELAAESGQRALRVLSTDQGAEQVVRLYRTLPMGALMDNPEDDEVKQAWRDGVNRLQESIYAYLDGVRATLFCENTKPPTT
jgi:hypothetical protein